MLIESLEKKTKLAMFTVLLAVSASAVTCGLCFYFAISLVRDQQQQVYVLDGSIPFMAERSKNEMTFDIEAKAHIQLFHQYFFDLLLTSLTPLTPYLYCLSLMCVPTLKSIPRSKPR